MIPEAGHGLNLHFQAQAAYDAVLEWLDRCVGGNTKVPPPSSCLP